MEIYELKKEKTNFRKKFDKLVAKLDLHSLNIELGALREQINAPNFWGNTNKAASITKKEQAIVCILSTTEKIDQSIDFFDMVVEGIDEGDATLEEALDEYNNLNSDFKKFEITILLSEEYDTSNAIIEIHPGAGGTESQDWANMIYDMYSKYINKSGLKMKVIDYQAADVAGLKSVTFEVSGDKAYGYLKGENGIHRLVRISPFDSNAKRHTSFAAVNVMPVIEDDKEIILEDSDLKIDVYRSGGAGGQSVNTTDSAVRITHLPTNTVVTCQNERSQVQNKEQAMKILKSRLVEQELQKKAEEKQVLAGEQKSNGWGSQKRSYVLHPYKMVKDHFSDYQDNQAEKVLSGDIDEFLYHNLLI